MEEGNPNRVIDVHSHLFNARYLPLKGVLEGLGVPGWLSGSVRDLLYSLTGDADLAYVAPGPGAEETADTAEDPDARSFIEVVRRPREFGEWRRAFKMLVAAKMGKRVAAARVPVRAAVASKDREAVLSTLRQDNLYASLERVQRLHLERAEKAVPARGVTGATELLEGLEESQAEDEVAIAGVTSTWSSNIFGSVLDWLLDQIKSYIEDKLGDAAEGYVQFLLLMLSSETTLYEEMLATYRDDQNVVLSVHLMMDMQYGYQGEVAYYPFDSGQIDRMAALVQQADGRLAGFVAFDPRRDNGLQLVQDALEMGNTGVKLYPPMGYVATGEDDVQRMRFTALYTYCVDNDVPILTHCSPVGFEAYDGAGVKSSPEYWSEVLSQFPKLRLCYGHAGGDMAENIDPDTGTTVPYPGWLADPSQWQDPRNFSRMVAEHCAQYEHVYCDFSYLTAVVDDDVARANLVTNLTSALEVYDGDYALGDKIMYGADWHMPSMAAGADEFLDVLRQVFQDTALQPYQDRFFYLNAERFLRLAVPGIS